MARRASVRACGRAGAGSGHSDTAPSRAMLRSFNPRSHSSLSLSFVLLLSSTSPPLPLSCTNMQQQCFSCLIYIQLPTTLMTHSRSPSHSSLSLSFSLHLCLSLSLSCFPFNYHLALREALKWGHIVRASIFMCWILLRAITHACDVAFP